MTRQVTDQLYIELDYFYPEEFYTYQAEAESSLSCQSSVDCIISHLYGVDISAFSNSSLTTDAVVTRDTQATLSTVSTFDSTVELTTDTSVNLNAQINLNSSANRFRLVDATVDSNFNLSASGEVTGAVQASGTWESNFAVALAFDVIRDSSADLSSTFAETISNDRVRYYTVDLNNQFNQTSNNVRTRNVISVQNTEFTQQTINYRIVQGDCAFNALFAPSMTVEAVKNVFAVLDSTTALAVVANANRSAQVALASIVNLSLQGARTRGYAATLQSQFNLTVAYVNTVPAQASLQTTASLNAVAGTNKKSTASISSQFTSLPVVRKLVKTSVTSSVVATQTTLANRRKQFASFVSSAFALSVTTTRYAYRPNNATNTNFVTSTKATNSFIISPFNGYSDWTYFRTFIKPKVATTDISQRLITVGNQFYVDRERVSGVDYIKVNGGTSFIWSGQLTNQDYELRAQRRESPNSDIIDVYWANTKVGEVDLYYQTFVPAPAITNNVTWSGTFSGSQLSSFASGNSSVAISTDLQSLGAVPCWLYWDGTYLNFHTTIGVDNTAGATTWRNLHQRWSGLGIVSGSNYTISMQMNNNASYNGALLTLNGSYKSWGGVVSNSVIGPTSSSTYSSYYIANHSGGPIGGVSSSYITTDNRTFTGTLNAVYDSSYQVEYDELLIARNGYANEVAVTPTANTDDEWKFNSQRTVLGLYHFDNNGTDDIGSDIFEIITESVVSSLNAVPNKIVQFSATLSTISTVSSSVRRTRGLASTINSNFAITSVVRKIVQGQSTLNCQFAGQFNLNRIRRSTSSNNVVASITAVPYNFTKYTATLNSSVQLTIVPNRIKRFNTQFSSIFSELDAVTKIGRGIIQLDVVANQTTQTVKTARSIVNAYSQITQSTQVVKTTRTGSDITARATMTVDFRKFLAVEIRANATFSQTTSTANSKTTRITANIQTISLANIGAIKTSRPNIVVNSQFNLTPNTLNSRNRVAECSTQAQLQLTAPAVKTTRTQALLEAFNTQVTVGQKIAFDRELQLTILPENRIILILEEDRLLMVPEETRVNMVRKIAQ